MLTRAAWLGKEQSSQDFLTRFWDNKLQFWPEPVFCLAIAHAREKNKKIVLSSLFVHCM
jgi:hypothetical protein